MHTAMSESRAPVSGTCAACGCPLGYVACRHEERWCCCGPCAGSDRCTCGCKPELARELPSDVYIPGRRMFASRHPDELQTEPDYEDKDRAFPFSDRQRGR